MMTTLRSDRRTRRHAMFNLEYLDDRIVLSAVGAEAHAAVMVSSMHAKAAAKAEVALERHDAHLAKVEAKLAKTDIMKPSPPIGSTPVPVTPITIKGGQPESSSSVAPAAVTASVVTVSTATPASIATTPATTSTQSITTSASANSGTSTTLPPNLSAQLQSLYTQFESSGGSGTFSPTGVNGLVISGTNVGINFHTSDSADFNALLSQLQSDGLQVTSDSAAYGIIDGMLPIAQLPTVAQLSSSASVTPMVQPKPL